MTSKHAARHGYAAFAPRDVDDAMRRRPPGSLQGYAAERSLEFKDRGGLAGFRGALPVFPEYVHNLVRGVLPGGRFGILYHELLQTHGRAMSPIGSFYGVRTSDRGGFFRSLLPNRVDIPIVGELLDPVPDEGELEAFETPGAWSPCTTAAVLVPETVAAIGTLRLIVKHRMPFIGGRSNLDLEPFGAPGWRSPVGDRFDDAALSRLFGGAVGAALRPLADLPYASVRVDHGTLVVRRSGYLMDPGDLDAFAATVSALADGLAAVSLDGHAPARFGDPLPEWPVTAHPENGYPADTPMVWIKDIAGFAERHRLTLEDPVAWHRAFPSVAVPGKAMAVMRAPSGLRFLFAREVSVLQSRAVRAAIVFPVAAGTPDTAPGGINQPQSRTVTTVTGGLAAVWSMDWMGYASDADGFADTALAAAAAAGVRPA